MFFLKRKIYLIYFQICGIIGPQGGINMTSVTDTWKDVLEKEGVLPTHFGNFHKGYLLTTENIKDFLGPYCLQDKNILTVTGSGDQMLNAYLMGAKNVTCFDINSLASYQARLKKEAVCALEYEEFLTFFLSEFGHIFDWQLYSKIAPRLDEDTRAFFDYLYQHYTGEEIVKRIYYPFYPDLKKMKQMNAYFQKEQYHHLSSILKEKDFTFFLNDITTLNTRLEKKAYDIILLSNISDSIDHIYSKDCLKNFKRLIHSLSKSLVPGGIIQVGYIYNKYYTDKKPLFSQKKSRENVFSAEEFAIRGIPSYESPGVEDQVVTFEKRIRIR